MSFGRDLSRELQRTRSRGSDLMIGPAHVIGSAVRYGYEPVARFPGEETAVFIASAASGVTSLEQAKGRRNGSRATRGASSSRRAAPRPPGSPC